MPEKKKDNVEEFDLGNEGEPETGPVGPTCSTDTMSMKEDIKRFVDDGDLERAREMLTALEHTKKAGC